MGDTDNSGQHTSIGLLRGIAFTILVVLGAALSNDSRLNTRGDFENPSNPAQRIVITSGWYFHGTARVSCSQASMLPWVSAANELVEYHREGDIITFFGSLGRAEFTISNRGLTDAENVVWDRKFRGD
ncbi:MAG: hypothetical protein U0936_14675 [Planctomycetaceae bacterium]